MVATPRFSRSRMMWRRIASAGTRAPTMTRAARSAPVYRRCCDDGKTGSRRALRARAGSRRGRRGRPVLQEPVLGAADSERRNCPGVLGVLSEVPAAISHLAANPPSAQQFLAQRICLESHLGESVFNDIADRNNSDKSTILHHGKMSELSKRHPFHKLQDRITFFAGYDLACHHLFDRFVTKLITACDSRLVSKCAHNISFR